MGADAEEAVRSPNRDLQICGDESPDRGCYKDHNLNYQSRLKDHLKRYKNDVLQITEAGLYRRGTAEVPHDHILPDEHEWLNLLEPTRTNVREYLAAHPAVTRHKDFRHLNSSQAFAFNLFFPFFLELNQTSGILLRALGQTGVVEEWEPESIPDPVEQTNVDIRWRTSFGQTTYCEVKLSEAHFARAPADRRHKDKFEAIYRSRLETCVEPSLLTESEFFGNYQLLRNLWHIVGVQESFLIFLLPRANGNIFAEAESFRLRITEPTRARVSVIAMEDVLDRICTDVTCPEDLQEYARSMRRKYVVDS